MNRSTSIAAVAALMTLASTAASAAGTHAGGHGHDDAIGKPGIASKATRTVSVDMTDGMRFNPSSIDVKQGETVRFVVTNSGKLKHELVLGTEQVLKEHYEVMKKNPEMEHADPSMVSLAAGKTGEIVWQFTKAGKVGFACLQPGHYDAGMKGAVNVAAAAQPGTGSPAPSAAAAPSVQATELADGEVRKIDKESKKLTLRHGPLKNLDMPGMTMVFQVKDATMLDQVQAGDKVRFQAEKIDGKFTITQLEAVH